MTAVPFQCFDPPPEVSAKEEAAYKKGYQEGMEAGRQAMGLYIPLIADALNNLIPYQEAYRQNLNAHMVEALKHILRQLVMPLSVASEVVKARAVELLEKLDTNLTLHITVADPQALKGKLPEFATLNADENMSATDFNLVWGSNQATVASSQEELHKRLAEWLGETLELITTHEEAVL